MNTQADVFVLSPSIPKENTGIYVSLALYLWEMTWTFPVRSEAACACYMTESKGVTGAQGAGVTLGGTEWSLIMENSEGLLQ